MTDAALPVTERTIEQFTEAYLSALGAEIQKDGRRWTVSVPKDAETTLELDGADLEVASDPSKVAPDTLAVAPESEFVERLLDEAAERTPIGSMALTNEDVEVRIPPWINAGPVDVVEKSFTPYYDRQAICALFHVGIETVSEYQSEEIHAVAVDCAGHDYRPRLTEAYLGLTEIGERQPLTDGPETDRSTLSETLDVARAQIEQKIESTVCDIRERATRAAQVELDEYRQYVRQRRDELTEEIERLAARIEEISEKIDTATVQSERVGALRKRKELRSERDELRSERDRLAEQIEADFPKKRREIRDRHALTVRISPVALTVVSYERGDLELTLRKRDSTVKQSYAYAVGSGVMDDARCSKCGQQLSEKNPIAIDDNRVIGSSCCDSK